MELVADQHYTRTLLSRIRIDTVGEKPLPHLTELVYCLTRSYWQRRDNSGLATFFDDHTIIIFALGRGLEDAMLRPTGDPDRGELDGIHYEMDMHRDDEGLVEFKTTRMGTKRIAEQGIPWGWQRQILGYMYVEWQRTHKLPLTRVAILHMIPAELNAWRVKVTEEDLRTNWQWLQERKSTYMHFIESGEPPPPFTYNEVWECDGCPFRILCNIEAARLGIPEPEVKAAGEELG